VLVAVFAFVFDSSGGLFITCNCSFTLRYISSVCHVLLIFVVSVETGYELSALVNSQGLRS